jgi:hypothetical protein
MPSRSKGVRLYLKRAHGSRAAVWIIRDGARRVATGAADSELAKAEAVLSQYITARPEDLRDEVRFVEWKPRVVEVPIARVGSDREYVSRPELEHLYDLASRWGIGASEVCYCIGIVGDPRIKVGWTGNLSDRLRNLQGGNPESLVVFETLPGNCNFETYLHRTFRSRRLVREWFDDGDSEIRSAFSHIRTYAEIGGQHVDSMGGTERDITRTNINGRSAWPSEIFDQIQGLS